MPDRWLAEELLRLARETRRRYPDKHQNFVRHLVPEISKRLGATRLEPNEAHRYAGLSDQDLRQAAGVYLQNTVISRWDKQNADKPRPEDLLCHCVLDGNPVAFAMDRICPARDKDIDGDGDGDSDRDDLLAQTIRKYSKLRGHQETAHWSPALREIGTKRDLQPIEYAADTEGADKASLLDH